MPLLLPIFLIYVCIKSIISLNLKVYTIVITVSRSLGIIPSTNENVYEGYFCDVFLIR